jgi:hypothetical protein
VALLIACVLVGILAGRPAKLPAVALDSALLLYLERAVALFAGGLLLVVVVVEAWRGNLPTEISGRGVKYERLKEETKQGLQGLVEAIAEERKAREEMK